MSARNRKLRMLRKDRRCYYCKTRLTADTATIDHVVPLSKGGRRSKKNEVLACADCNRKKADSMPDSNELWRGTKYLKGFK